MEEEIKKDNKLNTENSSDSKPAADGKPVKMGREELLRKIREKVREEVTLEEREKLRNEMRDEVRAELKKELLDEVIKELRAEKKDFDEKVLTEKENRNKDSEDKSKNKASDKRTSEASNNNSEKEESKEEKAKEELLKDEDLEKVDLNEDESSEESDENDTPDDSSKKKPIFLIALGVYAALWIIVTIIVCCVLNGKFKTYQNNFDAAKAAIQPDAVAAGELYRFDVDHLRDSAGEGWITLNKYESDSVIDDYVTATLSGKELTCSANEAYSERHPSYNVYAGDLLIGTITLKHKTEVDQYGFSDYEFSELQVLLEGPETEIYTIKCYEGDDVYVNGELLSPDDATVFLTEDTLLDSYMSVAATEKSGVSVNECVYTLTEFVNEPEVTLEKYDKTFTVSDNSLRDEIVALGDEDTNDSDHYFNACVFFDDQLDYDLNDRLYNGFVYAGENFIYNMNLWGTFANVSRYLESGGPAYNAIASAQSGLSWAGRPDEFEIKSTEILSIVKYDDDTLVVTTYHTIHRLYRSVTYEEDMTVEWLYCKNGNAWLIRNFSYL